MPVQHYTLTLGGAAENLATALGLTTAAQNIPFKMVTFQAGGAADVFIGSTNTVSSTNYGFRAITAQGPVYLEGQGDGPIKLSQIFVIGTAAQRLHIMGVTF